MGDSAIAHVIAGLAVGIAFVLLFSLLAIPHLADPAFMQQGNSLILTADAKCAKYGEWASISDEGGFVVIKPFGGAPPLKANVETPDRKPGLYEFVLAPNSTGYITMVYDSCSQKIDSNITKFFEAFDTRLDGINKFDSNEQSESYRTGQVIWLPANDTAGVAVYPSEIKQENDHRLIVTYTVEADSNAQNGLYVLNLYHTCPGQLLTIGNRPHQSEIPWVNGPFYGCSF